MDGEICDGEDEWMDGIGLRDRSIERGLEADGC